MEKEENDFESSHNVASDNSDEAATFQLVEADFKTRDDDQSVEDIDGHMTNENDDISGRKRKHRRGRNKGGAKHQRKWRPYNTLSWDERQQIDDREAERAKRKREMSFANGQPMAPDNTTQFLMDQHENKAAVDNGAEDEECDVLKALSADGSGSVDSSEESESSEDELFMKKDFKQAYASSHAERLNLMTKEELVKEYMQLERKVEFLQRDNLENPEEESQSKI